MCMCVCTLVDCLVYLFEVRVGACASNSKPTVQFLSGVQSPLLLRYSWDSHWTYAQTAAASKSISSNLQRERGGEGEARRESEGEEMGELVEAA